MKQLTVTGERTLSLGDAVWERSGEGTMSRNLFMLAYGAFTLLGLLVTAIVSFFTTGWIHYLGNKHFEYVGPGNFLVMAIGVLVVAIIGIVIALKSDNPVISLIGYMLVAAPFGLILGPTVGMYQAASVVKVLFVTGLVSGVLMLVGAVIPESLESWGGWLFGGLSILILGQFGIGLGAWLFPGFPLHGALTLWDWLGVLVFSGYVIYDFNQALRVPPTLDNAIDCALAMYLDLINLFLRFLELMGKLKGDED